MIRFDNVHFSYAQGQPDAISDLSFALPEGSFHFLCGPSGAGKTTLFRMMYLDLLPTSGFLTVFGKNVLRLNRHDIALTRRHMGIVFQDFRLLDNLRVRENVELPLTLLGQPSKEQLKCVDDILDWVGLSDKRDMCPTQLSGGEKQRVAIARAVVSRPKFLVADEPTGNVDAAMGKRIMHLFCELHKHGTTVLVATHDRSLVKKFNFPILNIEGGKLIGITQGKTAQSIKEEAEKAC